MKVSELARLLTRHSLVVDHEVLVEDEVAEITCTHGSSHWASFIGLCIVHH